MDFRSDGLDEIGLILRKMTDKESSKLLQCVADKLVERERLFHRKLQSREGGWDPPSAEYLKRKHNRGRWNYSGSAIRGIAKAGEKDGPLIARSTKKSRRLIITMRKMVKGQNVYAIVQRGRFGGVKMGKKTLTADQTIRRNAGLLLSGKKPREKSTRISVNPMPITTWDSSDARVVLPLIREEFAITLKLRGIL